ncbi:MULTISPECIES: hypothetical protein [Wolbachia]|uniref:hypothetical protein n=1 Tax=Wolbachia TaxID=953 RepID=UPI0012E85DEA|nr:MULTISPECIES: hypothetical protein [Wolbachia]MBA8757664.1 hypothetical protein [Wolbachia pipientis]
MTSLSSRRHEPSYRDSFAVSHQLTSSRILNRHTVTVSLSIDPANKQRDDDCRLAINIKKFTK